MLLLVSNSILVLRRIGSLLLLVSNSILILRLVRMLEVFLELFEVVTQDHLESQQLHL